MKNTRRKCKQLFALVLTAAMLVTELPMTTFAAPAEETVEADYSETELSGEEIANGSDKEQPEITEPSGETDAAESGEEQDKEQPETTEPSGETDAAESDQEQDKEQPETIESSGETENDGSDEEQPETTESDEEQPETTESGEEQPETEDAGSEADDVQSDEAQSELTEAEAEFDVVSDSDFVIQDGVLTSYTGTAENVVIPDGVVTIKTNAFRDNKVIKTVQFPESVTTIENRAFSGCSNLNVPELNEGLVTIGGDAFRGAALGEKLSSGEINRGKLIIPGTVKSIGVDAFSYCNYLGEVEFENGDAEVLKLGSSTSVSGTFSNCLELTKVTLPSRLTEIENYTFSENPELEEVVLGNKIETIGKKAFYDCSSLKSIDLPLSLRTIEWMAFARCSSLGAVELNEGLVTIGESAFEGAALGEKLSTGVVNLGTMRIPSTVQSIGLRAFYKCTCLGEVIFENGETEVLTIYGGYEGTISSCPELTKITLPTRLTSIERSLFSENPKLEEVVLGNKVETIGKEAFKNCSSLKSIELPLSLRTIEGWAFNNCSSLNAPELNEGLVTIGESAFAGAALGEKLSSGKINPGTMIIPSTVQSIALAAFYNCAYLGEVIFMNGDTVVLTIDTSYAGTFSSCPELTTVILPERITKLEKYTFYKNAKLKTLYIPKKVTEIVDNAIKECPKLTIYGTKGSEAETYANKNKIPFKNESELDIGLSVKSVQLTPSVIEEIGENVVGHQTQLHAKVLPATAENKNVTYQSSDIAVATVDETGLVTIQGYGEAIITVTTQDGNKKARCEVFVATEPKDDRPQINSVLFPGKKTEYNVVYTGEQIRPVMTVAYQYTDGNDRSKTQKLKLNVDYTVSYSNNVNAGNTATVTVRGIGGYTGEIEKQFTITPKSIKNVKLSPVGDIVYSDNLSPSVTVTDGTKELVKGKDYTIKLSATGSAATDTPSVLTVEGTGNYTDTSKKSAKFNILKAETEILPITSENIIVEFKKLPAKGYTYKGKAYKPAVVVKDKTTGKKISSKMYKLIYTNNVNAGENTAQVQVVGVSKNGKGYYGITEPLKFSIKQKEFKKVSVSLKGTIAKVGNIDTIKENISNAITVKDAKHVFSEDEYTIDYTAIPSFDKIEIGKKYPITLMTANADGNYSSSADSPKTINIKFGQLSFASKTANISVRITDPDNNGIVLRYNGKLLENDVDYTATVKQDKNKETYTVKIKAVKGSAYKGSRTFKKKTVED